MGRFQDAEATYLYKAIKSLEDVEIFAVSMQAKSQKGSDIYAPNPKGEWCCPGQLLLLIFRDYVCRFLLLAHSGNSLEEKDGLID